MALSFFKKIGSGIQSTATDLSKKANSELKVIEKGANDTVKKVEQPFVTAGNKIQSGFQQAGTTIKSGFNKAEGKVVDFGKTAISKTEQTFNQVEKKVSEGFNTVAGDVKDFGGSLWGGVTNYDDKTPPPGSWGFVPYLVIGGAAVALIAAARMGLL